MPRHKDIRQVLGLFWGPKLVVFSMLSESFSGPVFCDLLDNFWKHFGSFVTKKSINKLILFLRGSWRLPGAIFGGFLAVLGSFGSLMFLKHCKQQYKMHVFKIA